MFPKKSAKTIDGTEKPPKFAKRAARYNEFGCNNGALISKRLRMGRSHPLGRAVSNVNFLTQELITLIAKDKGILQQNFMWLQELIRKTQP